VIVVIDYGMGNVGSIMNMLKKIGAQAVLSRHPDDIAQAERLILPGVGSFDTGMRNLRELGIQYVLNRRVVEDGIPILGICLGMQLFTKKSEEGRELGFGWLDAETLRFSFDQGTEKLKLPHMGWNDVQLCQPASCFPLQQQERRFYFVHSYYIRCNAPDDILMRTSYGIDFTSSFCHKNILGVQFHPEKSHRFGIEFFEAFLAWTPGRKG